MAFRPKNFIAPPSDDLALFGSTGSVLVALISGCGRFDGVVVAIASRHNNLVSFQSLVVSYGPVSPVPCPVLSRESVSRKDFKRYK
jgi:hypothetical protein